MFEKYLEETKYVDYSNTNIKEVADLLKKKSSDDIMLIKNTFYFVRDKIHHSWDVKDKRVTISASDVLREGVGICWAKANLLAALLRANGIPAGFSYQRIAFGNTLDKGYCIHTLNTIYIATLGKWIRLDARGNKEGVRADFSLEEEHLAFELRLEGEIDYHDNHPQPDEKLMKVLEESTDVLNMYLPDTLGYADENHNAK